MNPHGPSSVGTYPSKLFYGWYIVAVGFFSQMVFAFHLSSTLSVFLKPLTEDLGVSRGFFSLLRSGEIIIGAMMSPFIGSWVDRYGTRWLMPGGALLAGMGFILLSQVTAFWQFLLIRWLLVTTGGAFISSMVVSVTIARWFVRKRGRAIAVATLGQGISKVSIPLVATTLFIWFGWRYTWSVFGMATMILVIFPAIVFVRRSPEEVGLRPDGIRTDPSDVNQSERKTVSQSKADVDTVWTRREIMQTSAFWLLCVTFGMANVGIAGLNLHVFAHITDIGYPSFIAATVMSIIAFTQLGSTLVWGFLSERWEIRKTTMLMFMIQAVGLGLAISTRALLLIYMGFTWRQSGFTRSHMGYLLRSPFIGQRARAVDADYIGVRRGGRAVFWISVRRHRKLSDLVRAICAGSFGFGRSEPFSAPAAQAKRRYCHVWDYLIC